MGVEARQENAGMLSSVNRRLLALGVIAVAVALIISAGFYFGGDGNDDQVVSAPSSVISSAQATSPVLTAERAKASAADPGSADAPSGPTIDLGRMTTIPVSIGHIP